MILTAVALLALKPVATRFNLVNKDGFWWLAGPDKKPFFSLGVCCVTTGSSFMEDDPANPGYAAYRYYPNGKQSWAEDTVSRLQSWQFNTIGAWSDAKTLRLAKAPNLRFTPILHMGSGAGAPWKDMWDPQTVGLMDAIARDQMKELRGEKRVIGYFSDNEQGWWYGALFDWAWKGAHTRGKLVDLLQKRYLDWSALSRDFVPVGAADFAGLSKGGRLYLRPGGNGIAAVDAYIGMLAERYYSLCKSIIKKYDPAAFYLGDRYISNFYPAVAKAAGKYADVVSTNLNADWNDGSFSPFYLPSLYRAARKPLMITEYYMCATQNRSGNKNDSSGFPVVATQADRAQGFWNSTNILLSTPYVVGAHWFQYTDEPKNGRGDGENYDMGLVDVYNQPYDELTKAASSLDLAKRQVAKVSARTGAPEISPASAADLNKWPRKAAYWPPSTPSDRGDAFVAWAPDAAYVAVYWNEDRFAEAFYKDGKIPDADEPLLTIQGLSKPVKLRLVSTTPQVYGPVEIVALKTGVRNTAIIRIPASSLGLTSLSVGGKLSFRCVLQTRARAHTIGWGSVKTLTN